MKKSPRLFAGLISALMLTSLLLPTQSATAATVKAASAVRSVKVSDAWISSSPKTARAKLTWTRPSATFGATLVGYKVEISANKTSWSAAIANTGSTATNAIVSTGLRAGSATFFRVRAITKIGSSAKTGTASSVISKTLTAAPQPPALLGLTKISVAATGNKVIRWLPQTSAQKGSASTTYRVVAKATTGEEIACSATQTNYCTLNSLTAGVQYNISLTARNARGSEINIDEFKAQDADISLQWYLGSEHGIAATRAWTVTRGSSEVVVAVLDTGITSHEEFDGQLVPGYDFVSDKTMDGDSNPGRDADPSDEGDGDSICYQATPLDRNCWSSWHGTHVAGIIAAKSDAFGMTGIAPGVKVQPIRVLGLGGSGTAKDLSLGIRWAAGEELNGQTYFGETLSGIPTNATPAKVINLSVAYKPRAGTHDSSPCVPELKAAIDYALSKGVTIVAAAGNGDTALNPVANDRVYPSNCIGPISVGAVGFTGDVAFYSNFGVDLVAVGGDSRNPGTAPAGTAGRIYSTSNSGQLKVGATSFKYEEGTSMAAPVTSAIIALMYSIRPNIDSKTVWEALKASVQPFPAGSKCALEPTRCGVGTINAATALEALVAITG